MKDEGRRMKENFRSLHPSSFRLHPSRRLAYTLIEMLTTVAVLIILLGIMVSLARYVRGQSAERVTKELLVKLDHLMAQYVSRTGGQRPVFTQFIPDPPLDNPPPDERALQRAARVNSAD